MSSLIITSAPASRCSEVYKVEQECAVLTTMKGFIHCSGVSFPAVLNHILSHEDLAVRPFSQEVLWCLSFPGGSFGFVIYCPVKNKTKAHFYYTFCRKKDYS